MVHGFSSPMKVIALQNYFAQCSDPIAKRLFTGMVELRVEGYGPDYPEYYLSVDSTDYVGTHYLFCLEQEQGLVPVAGFRHVSIRTLDYYRLPVPLVSMASASGASEQQKWIEAIIDRCRDSGVELEYTSNFTVAKPYRSDRQIVSFLREVCAGLYVYERLMNPSREYIAGTLTGLVKNTEYYNAMGYRFLERSGAVMKPFVSRSSGKEMTFVHLVQPTAWAQACFEAHQNVYRTMFMNEESRMKIKKAA